MTHVVECYAGSTYPEQPRALTWEGQRYHVSAVLQRWCEPDGLGFLVSCSPDIRIFKLFYNVLKASWKVTPNKIILQGD